MDGKISYCKDYNAGQIPVFLAAERGTLLFNNDLYSDLVERRYRLPNLARFLQTLQRRRYLRHSRCHLHLGLCQELGY